MSLSLGNEFVTLEQQERDGENPGSRQDYGVRLDKTPVRRVQSRRRSGGAKIAGRASTGRNLIVE
jgi:hypothetical protein